MDIDHRTNSVLHPEPCFPLLAAVRLQIISDAEGVWEVLDKNGVTLALTFSEETAGVVAAALAVHR